MDEAVIMVQILLLVIVSQLTIDFQIEEFVLELIGIFFYKILCYIYSAVDESWPPRLDFFLLFIIFLPIVQKFGKPIFKAATRNVSHICKR